MSKETNQDMGTGSVKKLMVQMAVPAVVGQVINLLYNVVDRIYIGHIPEIGGAALTGVGLFTPILMLITAFAMLAMLNPLGVVASAIFVAGIFVGADAMSRAAKVPSYIADVMVATALLTMVTAILLIQYRVRWK